ncbi:MAG: Gfo/Idh/MocA family oxidoreductase [Clostridia bacterium]|nr:Gfo/Idh/MocA family oxidoreductase [Clostridia bacterium]
MYNWGIIGPGSIANRMADALDRVKGAYKYAVASRTLDRAVAFKKKHGFEKAYGSYEELYNDKDVDIVYIATPHNAHFKCALDAMNHGKNVLIEKPMTVNANEARELIECAKRNNVFCMEALWIRFLPLNDKINKALDKIGDVISVTADFSVCVDVNDMSCRLSNPDTAGGALLDLGVYPLNLADMYIDAAPENISSVAYMSPAGVDMNDVISLGYKGGKTAMLRTSLLFESLRDVHIDGTKGRIRIPNFIWFGRAEYYKDYDVTEVLEAFYDNGFQYEVKHVMDCLDKGMKDSDVMPLYKTLRITETMDKLRNDWNLKYPFE